jgi:hypothetical protein
MAGSARECCVLPGKPKPWFTASGAALVARFWLCCRPGCSMVRVRLPIGTGSAVTAPHATNRAPAGCAVAGPAIPRRLAALTVGEACCCRLLHESRSKRSHGGWRSCRMLTPTSCWDTGPRCQLGVPRATDSLSDTQWLLYVLTAATTKHLQSLPPVTCMNARPACNVRCQRCLAGPGAANYCAWQGLKAASATATGTSQCASSGNCAAILRIVKIVCDHEACTCKNTT